VDPDNPEVLDPQVNGLGRVQFVLPAGAVLVPVHMVVARRSACTCSPWIAEKASMVSISPGLNVATSTFRMGTSSLFDS
jgi:hypothetical protein